MSTIIIPKFVEAKPFYDEKMHKALANCQSEGFDAQFIPEIMDSRSVSDKDNEVWNNWYCAPSVRITGTTKNGRKVVVYAHVPNYFSNPKHIQSALKTIEKGAGIYPEKELQRLVSMEDGERVFVLDYVTATKAASGVMSLDEARENVHTVPFIGGKARTEKYLAQYKKIVGDKIGVWHSDDMDSNSRARVLYVSGNNDYNLDGGNGLGDNGRFLGVRSSAEGASAQKKSPLETLVGKGRDVGNGIVVMNKDSISREAYNIVTGKYTNKQ